MIISTDLLDLIGQMKEMPLPDPPICGVYFLIEKRRVVYVGASTDIVQRIASHWKPVSRAGGKKFDEVRYIELASFEESEELEHELIKKLRPPLNRYIPGGKV